MKNDGLAAILNKDEIVPTRIARDFLDRPQDIDDLYKHHVRTYIPLQTGSDEASGVGDFSKKFIKAVKESRAPRGYITADFGYGKTSAGLFVWQQAQAARLIAVPPFKLNRLEDLLDATAGWMTYILEKNTPNLVGRAREIYHFYHDRELKSIADRYGVTLEQAQRMYDDQALQLAITPKDIVRFFGQMTELAIEAGFEGLVVIPDELQQYLEPEIKSGKIAPLVPFFDLVGGIMDQQGSLSFGFLVIITSKELGVINDDRGDLIDRLRGHTLDLRAIYDREFAIRLWKRFSETFDYAQIAPQIVDDYTLDSLGQISSRQDLSNGPRTVINAFRQIAHRALATTTEIIPYNPINLIDDFLANNIAFDARKSLQEATNKALASAVVRGQPELENAIKLLAAFPVDGATSEIQTHYGLQDACSELKISASPEIVIEIGDRHNPALVLRALDKAQENTDELTLILREFVRNYQPQAANQIERAVNAFISLLASLVFKTENWSQSKLEYRRFMQNAELILVGAFPEMTREFPERTIFVQVLGDDEENSLTKSPAEASLTFILHRHFDTNKQERQKILGAMEGNGAYHHAAFELNLSLPCFDSLNRLLQDQLRRVIDVDDVDVLMILALHDFLQRAVERDGVSKTLKDMIQRSMAIRLLETALEVLFNSAVGSDFQASGSRIVEKTVTQLIKSRYGDQYFTLISYKQWRDRLRDYMAALKQLPSFAQKQGYAPVVGKKDDIAKYFGTTAASFDAFQSRLSDLIKIEDQFSRSGAGSIKFTRHPLEETIFASLEDSTTTAKRNGEQRKALKLDDIFGGAAELGYREDEVRFILEIMQSRDLIEVDGAWMTEKPRPQVSPQKIKEQLSEFKRNSDLLFQVNQRADSEQMSKRAGQYLLKYKELDKQINEMELIILAEQIKEDMLLLEALIEREQNSIRESLTRLELRSFAPDGGSILTQMIRAGSFTTQLNHIRVQYSQVLGKWNDDLSAYQESLAELKHDANALALESLQRIQGRINQLKQKHLDLNEKRKHLELAIQKIKAWQEIADLLHNLLESIQKLGKPAEDLLHDLQAIENSITREFQSHSEKAFDNTTNYQQQLSRLETQLDRFASQAEREFTQLQEQYRELFIRYAGLPKDKLWQKIYYSANNVDGVYANLYGAVEKQVTSMLDNLYLAVEQCSNSILALRTMPSNANSDSDALINPIEQSLEKVDGNYSKLTDKATSETLQDIETFKNWLGFFDRISNQLGDVQSSLQKLRDQPGQTTLSPDEKIIVDTVNRFGTSANLVRVRQELNNLSDDAFWQTLRAMWERQLIEVKLQKVE